MIYILKNCFLKLIILLVFIFSDKLYSVNKIMAYWQMNNGTGTNLIDKTGNHNGIIKFTETVSWTNTGISSNTSLYFEGVNNDSGVMVNDDEDLRSISNQMTVVAWFKHSSSGGDLITGIGMIGRWRLFADDTNSITSKYRFYVWTDTNVYYGVFTSSGITNDEWHCLAGVFTGTDIKIYVDGNLNNSNHFSDIPVVMKNVFTNWSIAIGARENYSYKGFLDEIRLYNYALSDEEISNIYFVYTNVAVTANAGSDQTVIITNTAVSVRLDGSGSTYDGRITNYIWQMNGTNIGVGVIVDVILPEGTNNITLVAYDNSGSSESDGVEIVVVKNEVPTADGGTNATYVTTNSSINVTLDGSGSTDNDGGITNYIWQMDGTNIATGINPSINLPVGTNIITLTVYDNYGYSDSDVVNIYIIKSNNISPVANAGHDQFIETVYTNAAVNFNGSLSYDIDGNITNYTWQLDGNTIAAGTNQQVYLSLGTHIVILTVEDNCGAKDSDAVEIVINKIPVANAGTNMIYTTTNSSVNVILNGSNSSDYDGSIVDYKWKVNDIIIATNEVSQVSLSIGEHTVSLVVTDNKGSINTDSIIVNILKQTNILTTNVSNLNNIVYEKIINKENDYIISNIPENTKICLFSLTGKLLKNINIKKENNFVYAIISKENISYFTTGVYILKFTHDKETVLKIVLIL